MNSAKASSSNPFKKIKLTIIPPRELFVNISSDEDVTTTPSPITTSLSLTPPNTSSKTTSTNQTSSNQENTSSSFQSKLQISPPSLIEPTSPYLLNPLIDNISNVPPRPSNPQPLQSHSCLDITLSLSPITPFDHIHDIPSPPFPPQPQPLIMGNPLYYNYHDYHGSNCIAEVEHPEPGFELIAWKRVEIGTFSFANFTLGAQGDLETRLGHLYQLKDDVGRLWSEYYMLELARNDVEESLWPRLIMVQKKEMWPTLRPRIDKELLVSCFQRKELDHRGA
ncbi:hypothetical protein Tco_0400855 [Tanacetum coccineum]